MLSDPFLAELRKRLDIVDVVSEYVSLRRTGRNFVGLCPFHNERSPSFSVNPERQFYHCFGCGAAGDVIRFIMDIEGLPFPDAARRAAERAGMDLPVSAGETERSPESTSRRQRMKDAHELAAKWYSYILMNTAVGVQALTYLEKRGMSKSTMVQFRVGFAPDERQGTGVVAFLKKRGYEPELLVESGLAIEYSGRVVDRFRARVMIPIADAQGAVVGFGGRALASDGKPKYLNSPETPIFHKSHLLFNQHVARKAIRTDRTAVLMEGYMDAIAAWQAGVENAVASLGTAFSAEQATLLRRYTERLAIAYDGDNAGVMAARKALVEAESAGLECRVLVLPDGADPDEYIRKNGAQSFRHQLDVAAMTPVQFGIYLLRREADLRSVGGRQTFVRKVLSVLAERASPIEVEAELRHVSTEFQVSIDSLKEELSHIAKSVGPSVKRRFPVHVTEVATVPVVARSQRDELAGRRILQAMMTDPNVSPYLLDKGIDELATPEQTALLALHYVFRAQNPKGQATEFVDGLEHESLRRLAIAVLMMDDAPAPSTEVVNDYLRTIEIERTMAAWRVAIEEWKQAELRGDDEAAATAKERMDALAQKLQRLKSAPHPVQMG